MPKRHSKGYKWRDFIVPIDKKPVPIWSLLSQKKKKLLPKTRKSTPIKGE